MLLFYIRHGDPTYNPDALTPLGHRQAESVAKRLALFGIDEIYSSDSTRAMETAQPLCELLGKKITRTIPNFHETLAYRELSVPLNETERRWIWTHPDIRRVIATREMRDMGERWYEHPSVRDYHFERGIQRVGDEADAFLASLGYEHDREKGTYICTAENPEKRVALFAHEGVGKLFLSRILDVDLPQFCLHFDLQHTGMTVVELRQCSDGFCTASVLTLSNDSHLYRDGLPLDYQHRIRF